MTLYVVRHVKAGDRSSWPGDDDDRPVSKTGRRQAEALTERLAGADVTALISSPSVRCVQSLEPLGERLGIAVETDKRLAEGSGLGDILAVVRDAPSGAVLCSHGDVIPDLISALQRRGMRLETDPDWRKATLWVLDGHGPSADGEPAFASARVEPPPPV
jgi:8-oxo-dGTP diphosphatase